MRMLKPSPGECADRQTILLLKIQYGGEGSEPENVKLSMESGVLEKEGGVEIPAQRVTVKGTSKVNIKPFQEEHELLQRYLENNWFPDIPKDKGVVYDEYLDQLADVNERLWKLEDEARALRKVTPRTQTVWMRAGEVLFTINDENDQRAELVQKINKLFDVQQLEKLY